MGTSRTTAFSSGASPVLSWQFNQVALKLTIMVCSLVFYITDINLFLHFIGSKFLISDPGTFQYILTLVFYITDVNLFLHFIVSGFLISDPGNFNLFSLFCCKVSVSWNSSLDECCSPVGLVVNVQLRCDFVLLSKSHSTETSV